MRDDGKPQDKQHGAGFSRRISRRAPGGGKQPPRQPNAQKPGGPTVWQMMDADEGPPLQDAPKDLWQMMGNAQGPAQKAPADLWQLAEEQPAPEGAPRGDTPPKKKRPQQYKRQRKPKKKRRWGLIIPGGVLAALLALCVGLYLSVRYNSRNDDLWLDLDQIPYRTGTILYSVDRDTGELSEYARLAGTQHKVYTEPGDFPGALRDAVVAVEDQDFYNHGGVSWGRTAYAILNEIKHGLTGSYIGDGIKQGASTINQQLVKNLTRDDETSGAGGYMRKLREIYRARAMDGKYEKDTILCAYLNTVSFTGNTAGAGTEALKLFGKPVQQLSLAECASLAAIVRNPARYNPVTQPENHLERRNYVLSLMAEQGYITADECAAATARPLELNYQGEAGYTHVTNSYFTDTVIEAVVGELVAQRGITRAQASDLIYNGGLRIVTTVDPQLQSAMESALTDPSIYPQIGKTVSKPVVGDDGAPVLDESGQPVYEDVRVTPQAAMVSLDYAGGICAIVGGYGEKEVNRGFNRATSAVRQVGSTMKPIGPYAVAFERNSIHWSSLFLDAPVKQMEDEDTGKMVDWPANATGSYSNGQVLVRDAMARSINTVAVRVGELVGTGRMYDFVRKTLQVSTITGDDKDLGPLVLGSSTYGITPLEMAKAYAMFGSGGVVNEPYCFTAVRGGAGQLFLQPQYKSTQAIGADTAYVMNRLLGGVLESGGTAAGMAVRDGMESVGKTGTTSDRRDHWFVGLTPYYVTASWFGYDENLPLGVDSHWNPPILAWRTVMEQGQRGLAGAEFPADGSVVQVDYCTQSGCRAGAGCPSRTGYYRAGRLPDERCPAHGQ